STRSREWEPALGSERRADVERRTRETSVSLALDLDGSGRYEVSTGIGMFDHMLEQLARHALFDLRIAATGDIERDPHHLIENVKHLLEAFAQEGRLNLHARLLSGENDHHRVEALFKALARALRVAVTIDARIADEVPSTKEVL